MRTHVIYDDLENGLFAKFLRVIKLLSDIDGTEDKVLVNWDCRTHYYYDEGYGKNVWDYYFKPIFNDVLVVEKEYVYPGYYGYNDICVRPTAERIQYIVNKYIQLKDSIIVKIEDFYNKAMKGKRILGINKRGNAMYSNISTEFRKWKGHFRDNPIDITDYFKSVDFYLKAYDALFLITDEYSALEEFKKNYGNKLIHYDGVLLSNSGEEIYLDQGRGHPFKIGEDVVIEAALLSKVDKIIATKSNVVIGAFGLSKTLKYEDLILIDKNIKAW